MVVVDVGTSDLMLLAKSLAVVLECQGASPLDALDMASKWIGKVLHQRDPEFCEEQALYARQHDVDQDTAMAAVWERRVRELFDYAASTGPDGPLPHATEKHPVKLRYVATAATAVTA